MAFELTSAQKGALETGLDVSVIAGAGSGKTRMLVEKILKIIRDDFELSGRKEFDTHENNPLAKILCITFTNKAADELTDRVYKSIFELHETSGGDLALQKFLADIMLNISDLTISTMDSFFSATLRKNALNFAIPSAYSICDGGTSKLMFKEAVNEVISSISSQSAKDGYFGSLLNEFYSFYKRRENIYEILSQMLSKSIYLTDSELKTPPHAEFEKRVKDRIENLEAVCCAYLLNELRRFRPFNDAMGFFEGLVSSCGAGFKPKPELERLIELYSQSGAGSARAFFRHLASGMKVPRYSKEAKCDKEEFSVHKTALVEGRDRIAQWFDFKSEYAENISEFEYRFYASFFEIYRHSKAEYEKRKKAENMLDFQDVADLIASDDDTLRSAGARYSHILIDEFQDTNRLQVGIVKAMRPGPKLTIVGDAMQSIYRFRNAQCALFGELSSEFAEGGGKIVRMNDNFRSNNEVLGFVNEFFEYLSGERTEADEKLSDIGYGPLKSSRPPKCAGPSIEVGLFEVVPAVQAAQAEKGTVENGMNGAAETEANVASENFTEITGVNENKSAGGKVNKTESDDGNRSGNENASGNDKETGPDEEEGAAAGQYEFIARRILKLQKDGVIDHFGEVMILMSRMTHVEKLEAELKKYGVGYYLHKSRKFYSRNEIFDVLNLVRFIASPDDNLGIAGLLRSPLFAVADGLVFDIVSTYREALKLTIDRSYGSIYEALKLFAAGKLPPVASLERDPAEKNRICFIYKSLSDFVELAKQMKPFELLYRVMRELSLDARYEMNRAGLTAVNNIKKLIAQLARESYLSTDTFHAFAETLENLIEMEFDEEESQETGDTAKLVSIMTVHQAKGLEKKVVIVPELEAPLIRAGSIAISEDGFAAISPKPFEGRDPLSLCEKYHGCVNNYEKLQGLFERKRLLYVAMTRACEKLILCGAFKMKSFFTEEGGRVNQYPPVLAGSWLSWIFNYLDISRSNITAAGARNDGLLMKAHKTDYILWCVPPEAALPEEKNEAAAKVIPEVILNDITYPKAASEFRPVITYSGLEKFIETASGNSLEITPEMFMKRHVHPKPPSRPAISPEIAGNAFHYAVGLIINCGKKTGDIELWQLEKSAAMASDHIASGLAIDASALSKRVFGMLKNLVRAAADNEDIKFIFNAPGYKRRLEKKVGVSNDKFTLYGVCDMLMTGPEGQAVIVDFKTGDMSALLLKNRDKYLAQLDFYEYCVRRGVSGIQSVEKYIVFLNDGPSGVAAELFQGLTKTAETELLRECGLYSGALEKEYLKLISR